MAVGGTTYFMVRNVRRRLDTCRLARIQRVGGRCFCFFGFAHARVGGV